VRENILDKDRSKDLRVYAVWLNQRITDERGAIDESTLADPRVTQYWDGQGITGTFFAKSDLGGLGYSGFVYDVFYVFDGDARWNDVPAPLAAADAPVVSNGEQLLSAIRTSQE